MSTLFTKISTLFTKTVSKLNLRTSSWRAVMHSANLSEQTEVQDANCDESFVNFAFTKCLPLKWTKTPGL